MRYRLDVVSPTVRDAVRFAGGWVYDRVMAGWDVTVLVGAKDLQWTHVLVVADEHGDIPARHHAVVHPATGEPHRITHG
ncbi:hypothetical protein C6A85_14110, partial [Mycobacterium sp. ITM-2017-0098]